MYETLTHLEARLGSDSSICDNFQVSIQGLSSLRASSPGRSSFSRPAAREARRACWQARVKETITTTTTRTSNKKSKQQQKKLSTCVSLNFVSYISSTINAIFREVCEQIRRVIVSFSSIFEFGCSS